MNAGMVEKTLISAGVEVSARQARLLTLHARMVLEANERLNLTRIVEPSDVLTRHILDSLLPITLTKAIHGRVIDIGSGAGFPGIPLAIMGYDVTLCESVKKKAALLASWVEILQLDSRVVAGRAEELALVERAGFDTMVCRAVSSLASLVELASPLLVRDGHLVAWKGQPSAEELSAVERAAKLVGMRYEGAETYSLPSGDARSLHVFRREGTPRVELPRRPGMAQRQPLGG